MFDLPGYVCAMKCTAPSTCRAAMAPGVGIAVYMKHCVADHVKFWKSADDGTYIWLHIEPHAGCTEHIAFATCYMPPYYANTTLDTFHRLTTDMDNFASRVPAGKQPHYRVCGTPMHTLAQHLTLSDLDGHGIFLTCRPLTTFPADLKRAQTSAPARWITVASSSWTSAKTTSCSFSMAGHLATHLVRSHLWGGVRPPSLTYHMASAWLASCAQQLEVLDMASGACRVCSDHLPVRVCFQLPSADGEPPLAGTAGATSSPARTGYQT